MKAHRIGCEATDSFSCECPSIEVYAKEVKETEGTLAAVLAPPKYDAWVEGTPMYAVPDVPGVALQVGTTYASTYGDIHLKISLNGSTSIDASTYRKIVRASRRRLHEIINGNRAQGTIGMLSPDEPQFIPQHKPHDAKWVVCFWIRPGGGSGYGEEEDGGGDGAGMVTMKHTSGRPVMALRLSYSAGNVQAIKALLKKERRTEAAGVWMPKPWALWAVWDWRAVAGVLGGLRQAGYHLMWVARDGFPPAPPIEEPTP